jgi:hypothetical protein
MALPKLLEDLAFISKLGDYPSSDDNLTPEQFKNRFDMAALRIQEYLNNQLIPGIDQTVDFQALLNGSLDTTLSLSNKAANAKATGDAINKKLDKTGGNVTGNIDMGGKRVVNLGTPVNTSDMATKGYIDAKHAVFTISLPVAGWIGSGPFTQTVAVNGILSTDRPHWDVMLSTNTSAAIAELESFAVVDDLDTANNSVMFTCLQEKPEVNLTIQMEVNR